MGLLSYKHKKKETEKRIEKSSYSFDFTGNTSEENEIIFEPKNNFDEQILVKTLLNSFRNKFININKLVDSELYNSLVIFEDSIKELVPFFSGYLSDSFNGTTNVNLSALNDALLFLKDHVGINDEYKDLMNNTKKVNILNDDYKLKDNGEITKNGEVIFNPNNAEELVVSKIDFVKQQVVFFPGIVIPFSFLVFENFKNSVSESSENSHYKINYNPAGKEIGITSDDSFYTNLILNNNFITDKKINEINFKDSELKLSDLSFFIDTEFAIDNIKKIVLSPENINGLVGDSYEECQTKNINFLKLLMLIIIGGGNERVAPLTPRGTLRWSTERVCDKKGYDTWHLMSWSPSKKQGLKISILQILEACISLFYGANLPVLRVKPCIGRKKFRKCWNITIFPGICLFGGIQKLVYNFQADISAEINSMFACNKVYYTPKYVASNLIKEASSTKPNKYFEYDYLKDNSAAVEAAVEETGSIIKTLRG